MNEKILLAMVTVAVNALISLLEMFFAEKATKQIAELRKLFDAGMIQVKKNLEAKVVPSPRIALLSILDFITGLTKSFSEVFMAIMTMEEKAQSIGITKEKLEADTNEATSKFLEAISKAINDKMAFGSTFKLLASEDFEASLKEIKEKQGSVIGQLIDMLSGNGDAECDCEDCKRRRLDEEAEEDLVPTNQ